MQIRPAAVPPPDPSAPPGPLVWRVPGPVIVAKFGVAALVALLALLPKDPVAVTLGLAFAVGLAGYAVRDLAARVRLVADTDGVTVVRGFAGRRQLAWEDLERVRVDTRPRLGSTTRMLEFDGGTELYLLSQFDLGRQPEEVFEQLVELRPALREDSADPDNSDDPDDSDGEMGGLDDGGGREQD